VNDFLLTFPSNLAPIVGQQVTLRSDNAEAVSARIDLMIAQASTPYAVLGNHGTWSCDLVVHGVIEGEPRGFLFLPAAQVFESDRGVDAPLTDEALRASADQPGQALTYTCVPPGSGPRMGLDRDGDGVRNGDELDAG
jgi:hypothetical protein